MAYTFKAGRVFVLDFVVDLEHVVVAHTGEDNQAQAVENAAGLEGDVVVLVAFDLVHDVVEVLAGNQHNNDDAGEKGNQVVKLEVGGLASQQNRVDDDVQHDDPEVRRVLHDMGEVFFENALQNGEGAVEAVVADVGKADDQEVTLQEENDFDLVTPTTMPSLRPCRTVTRMSE